ncbi:MAG: AMP-binding protein [Acidobacteriaceae bacterium]|nr:AMP-binding protein [Acidobacteriaceae bacterium]
MTLTDLFDLSLRGRPDTVALEFEGNTYTFGDLECRSNRLAQFLISEGFSPGDRLCVYLANSVEMVDIYLACIKAGVIFVPINILYRDREISHILQDAEPRAVISDQHLPVSVPFWTRASLMASLNGSSSERPPVTLDGDCAASIIYTSGTTGTAKGAVLSHNNFAVNALNLLTCWQITSADRLLLALPLFHVHGLGNGLHCALISGCRTRLLERFAHESAGDVFLQFRPTLFFGVPAMYVRMLEWDPVLARKIGSFMRLYVSGSAPLPAAVLDKFETLFQHRILERYGMSETLMNISNPYLGERRAGTVGLPLPGVSARLLDADGKSVPAGETGELYLRGPNVFSGYWKREETTRSAFLDGFFRTGDLATRSPDGYYTLCGRKSDLIISGGFNIYPREIEEFLQEQPEIQEAAVVGVSDPVRGEVPIAYVVAAHEFEASELESRCRSKIASFKIPRRFVRVESLPRNALGKIQKHLLPKYRL